MQLTQQGVALFERIFPDHLAHLQRAFVELPPDELANLEQSLRHLREALVSARNRLKDAL